MARTATKKLRIRTTALGDLVRQFRDENGWTQVGLQDELGIAERKQYVSKIETGAIQRPDDIFFKAFSNLCLRPEAELRELATKVPARSANDIAQQKPRQLKLVFGHSIWAAPIVVAAYDELLEDFQVSSFISIETNDDIEKFGPDEIASCLVAVNRGVIDKGDIPLPSNAASKFVTLAAGTIIDLLEADDIDIAVVPTDLLQGKRNLQSIGTLMHSSEACTLVATRSLRERLGLSNEDNGKEKNVTIGFDDVCEALLQNLQNPSKLWGVIGIERGTIPLRLFQEGWKRRQARGLDISEADFLGLIEDSVFQYRNSELIQSDVFTNLGEKCRSQGIKKPLQGLITWSPHANWVCRGDNGLEALSVRSAAGPYGHRKDVTLSVVVSRTLLDGFPGVIAQLSRLMSGLATASADVISVSTATGQPTESNAAWAVGRYFGLLEATLKEENSLRSKLRSRDYANCLKALGPLHFPATSDTVYHVGALARTRKDKEVFRG